MIRIALPAMLMLAAGCSAEPQSEQPVANAVAATTPPTRVSAAPPAAAAGNGLRATVSDLTGTVSGLNTRMTEMGLVIDLPADALFEYDKADLTPAAEAELRKAAELIRRSPPGAISIVGHTDGKGNDAYNQRLSEARADAVADWFRQQVGVRARAFAVSGKGESAPIAPNAQADGRDDPAGRARNRRVEVIVPAAME